MFVNHACKLRSTHGVQFTCAAYVLSLLLSLFMSFFERPNFYGKVLDVTVCSPSVNFDFSRFRRCIGRKIEICILARFW